MLLKMFSIRDSKSEVFGRPFYQVTMGEAERSFRALLDDDKSQVGKFPEDYDLYYVGEYDDQLGIVSALETPQHIVKALSLKRPM